MARYLGPTCKLARRAGTDLFLKSGAKSLEYKCKIKVLPGQSATGGRGGGGRRQSDFALHLREKQKLRRIYGLMERQFRNYYRKAASSRGATGEILMQMLESRLDNLLYRMGFAVTRAEARQMVSHKQALVDGKRVGVASFAVRPGQMISLSEKAREHVRVRESLTQAEARGTPIWVEVDIAMCRGVFRELPKREDINLDINESLIVEYYSR